MGIAFMLLLLGIAGIMLIHYSSVDISCPRCKSDMEYKGDVVKLSNGKRVVKHMYKCPHCGEIKTV